MSKLQKRSLDISKLVQQENQARMWIQSLKVLFPLELVDDIGHNNSCNTIYVINYIGVLFESEEMKPTEDAIIPDDAKIPPSIPASRVSRLTKLSRYSVIWTPSPEKSYLMKIPGFFSETFSCCVIAYWYVVVSILNIMIQVWYI